MKVKTLILLTIFSINSTVAQLNLQVEPVVERSSNILIKLENDLKRVLTSANASMRFSIKNLQSGNLASSLVTIMESLIPNIRDSQTLGDLHPFLNFTNPENCDYILYRLALCHYDIFIFQRISRNLIRNATKLYEISKKIHIEFAANYKAMQVSWTRALTVQQLLRHIWNSFNNYFKFNSLIQPHLKYMIELQSYLNASFSSSGCVLPASIITAKGNYLEDPLEVIESELQSDHVVAISKIDEALKVEVNFTKLMLIDLQNVLNDTGTLDDYPDVGWPRIPDIGNPSKFSEVMFKIGIVGSSELCVDTKKYLLKFLKFNLIDAIVNSLIL